ncbi:hypothetical protein DL96DRAFT_1719044 [Flagelloscypha sp. PMI_526]|nr:hypothetical protein DL96DRAFT_1719044 [Flagelloscypha sp. PMI_526]
MCTGAILRTILATESTVATNIIKAQSAISFFPLSSFQRLQSVVTPLPDERDNIRRLDKYQTRGWKEGVSTPKRSWLLDFEMKCNADEAQKAYDEAFDSDSDDSEDWAW